jgi:lysophospholipase L1-like esterase
MTGLGAMGLAAFAWQGFPQRIPPAIRDITTMPVDEVADWRRGTCMLDGDEATFAANCGAHGRRPLMFLWGDSYAGSLYPGLRHLQAGANFGLAQYTTAGCPPLLDFSVKGRPHCVGNNDSAYSALSNASPDVVLLFSAWNYGDVIPALRELIGKIRALQISHVVVMGPLPYWDGGLPKAAYDYYRADPLHRMLPLRSSFRVSDPWYDYDRYFRAKLENIDVDYISTWETLCHGKECPTRPTDDAAQLMAFDYGHLTVPGAIYLAEAIAPCLFKEPHSGGVVNGIDRSAVCRSRGGNLKESRRH